MGKILYTEEIYKQKVESLYNKEFEVIGRFKGIDKPILLKDKYGVIRLNKAIQVFYGRPGIKCALNKTEYFMNQLSEKYPSIAESLHPMSEYTKAKDKMLFSTKYGLVSTSPDTLLAGHAPNVRSAIDRKDYVKNQLLFLYDNKYDFIINSDNRHVGRITLICPIHGAQSIDSDAIFNGCGCPQCNHGWEKSNVLYLIRLYNEQESFYKLGISYRKGGVVRRYSDYRLLGYNVDELKVIEFDDFVQARELETKLKKLISNNLYTPKNWEYKSSTECFTDSLLPTIFKNINYDIVSTSSENQSSCNDNGLSLMNSSEDI